jgi:hypothetical protein
MGHDPQFLSTPLRASDASRLARPFGERQFAATVGGLGCFGERQFAATFDTHEIFL